MGTKQENRYPFEPDYAVSPGEILQETIESLEMSQKQLADHTGLSTKTVNLIIKGKAPITYQTAIALERVTGASVSLWNNLEKNYREQLAKIKEKGMLDADLKWLNTIPTEELISREVIPSQLDKQSLLKATLAFFGVASSEAWNKVWRDPKVAARRSECFESEPGATATWLRLGELKARHVDCRVFNKKRFRKSLDTIRGLTLGQPEQFTEKMRRLCEDSGVALVFVPAISKAPWSGAARWLSSNKALIQLSLRYKWEDHFWFSFFHEAAHILYDGKKDVFISSDGSRQGPREKKADQFAADILIPRKYAGKLSSLRSRSGVQAFAKSIGIAAGIVVGRLQKEEILLYSHLNRLKRKFKWRDA